MQSDVDLVVRAQAGDRAAFGTLYDLYAPRIYDLCTHMLRNPDDAADATAEVFLAAAEHLDQLVDPAKVKSWLYAIARNEVYRRSKQRSREVALDVADVESIEWSLDEPEREPAMTATGDRDLTLTVPAMSAALVRDAALGLADRDRLVLEMTLAGGLDGRALGDALGVSVDGAHQAAHRMRERLARSVGALLVARKGQADCPGLQTVLADWDGTFSVLWRKRVARHADSCAVCGARRQSIPQKVLAGTFASVPFTFLIPPDSVREQVLHAVGLHAANPELPRAKRWRRRDGFPHPPDQARRRIIAAVGVTLAVVALGLGGIAVTASNDPDPSVGIGSSSSSSSSSTSTSTPSGSTAREVPDSNPTTDGPGTGVLAPGGTQGTTPAAPQQQTPPPPPPPTTPPGDTTGPALNPSLPPFVNSNTSAGCFPTPVTATASDPSGVTDVRMLWSGGTVVMTPTGGGTWQHTTWWPPNGVHNVTFRATDGLGNVTSAGRTTTAVQCIG